MNGQSETGKSICRFGILTQANYNRPMTTTQLEQCPDCRAWLPGVATAAHRYVGASPACWALFSALANGGEPPLAPRPDHGLLIDAYMVQHPGLPSNQAVQSVAVHLLALYGVLAKGVAPEDALGIRQRAVRGDARQRHARFTWLTPPDFAGSPTVADIVVGASPEIRAERTTYYVRAIWELWASQHLATIAAWYARYVDDEMRIPGSDFHAGA